MAISNIRIVLVELYRLVGPKGSASISPLPGLCDHTEKIYSEAKTIASKTMAFTSQCNFLPQKLAQCDILLVNIVNETTFFAALGFVC